MLLLACNCCHVQSFMLTPGRAHSISLRFTTNPRLDEGGTFGAPSQNDACSGHISHSLSAFIARFCEPTRTHTHNTHNIHIHRHNTRWLKAGTFCIQSERKVLWRIYWLMAINLFVECSSTLPPPFLRLDRVHSWVVEHLAVRAGDDSTK